MQKGTMFTEGTTLVKREKEKDKLRMSGGSWTINLENEISHIEGFQYITETHVYEITKTQAFFNGFEKTFNGERKLVVPIKYWNTTEKDKQI